MVTATNQEITKNLKDNIGQLEKEKANLQALLMQHEKMNAWLVRILFWRSKRDLICINRVRIQMIDTQLYWLRTKLFVYEKRAARTSES